MRGRDEAIVQGAVRRFSLGFSLRQIAGHSVCKKAGILARIFFLLRVSPLLVLKFAYHLWFRQFEPIVKPLKARGFLRG
jgi:hypothetical protein